MSVDLPSAEIAKLETASTSLVNSDRKRPSMFHSKQFIEYGDIVILFQTRDNMLAITVTPGQVHHSKWGKYGHDDMVGMRFGSRMASPPPQAGFIHILRPTPPLWSLSLPHRTQIVYLPDISFIMNQLQVRPGGRVIEAGTGSGSMSHSLGMGVAGDLSESDGQGKKQKGKVFTFEYHATRYEKAKEEFASHGLEHIIQLEHRNVCKDGFGEGPSEVDAVFLDLPAPWEAVPHTIKHLREDISTRVCSFSPCIEQVTRTVQALDAHGFTRKYTVSASPRRYCESYINYILFLTDIEMFEVLVRPHEVLQPAPTLISIETISSRLKRQEVKREERRQIQIDLARKRNARLKAEQETREAGMEVDATGMEGKRARGEEEEGEGGEPGAKRQKRGEASGSARITEGDDDAAGTAAEIAEEETTGQSLTWGIQRTDWVTRIVPEVRGHTSYLTFATMYPRSVREAIEKREQEKKQRVLIRTAELAGIPIEGGLAKTVAMRAVAASTAGGGSVAGSSSTGSLGGLPGMSDRSMTREASFDTQISDGFEKAIAAMTEEEFAALP